MFDINDFIKHTMFFSQYRRTVIFLTKKNFIMRINHFLVRFEVCWFACIEIEEFRRLHRIAVASSLIGPLTGNHFSEYQRPRAMVAKRISRNEACFQAIGY